MRVDAAAAVFLALRPAGLIVGDGWDRRLLGVAREHDVALVVEDEIDPGADGVHLTDPGQVADIRSRIDRNDQERLILGVDVGLSRHDAMVAGEGGADYVAFGARDRSADQDVFEQVAWWRSTTILPCLAYADDVETVTKLARIGTDFIGISRAVLEQAEDPAAAAELTAIIGKS